MRIILKLLEKYLYFIREIGDNFYKDIVCDLNST